MNIEKQHQLKMLRILVKTEIMKHGFTNQKSLAHHLDISEGMLSECVNFKLDAQDRLKGSAEVWRDMEKIFDIDIMNKLIALGLR